MTKREEKCLLFHQNIPYIQNIMFCGQKKYLHAEENRHFCGFYIILHINCNVYTLGLVIIIIFINTDMIVTVIMPLYICFTSKKEKTSETLLNTEILRALSVQRTFPLNPVSSGLRTVCPSRLKEEKKQSIFRQKKWTTYGCSRINTLWYFFTVS